jgi:hypothetical protein
MKNLKDIYFNELTLKCDKWIPYFKVYEQHLSKFVGKAPVIVEVGVQGGGSLQMWRKYFGPDAQLFGIDVDTSVLKHLDHYDQNTTLYIGDQADPVFWDEFLKQVPHIDILIDDGGHFTNQQIMTFNKVFPHITVGGVFICEDTHTSYFDWIRNNLNGSDTFIDHSKQISDIVNYGHLPRENEKNKELEKICDGLYSTSFYNSMVVFHKEELEVFERIVVNEK